MSEGIVPIAAALIAGGRSERMGRDKAKVPWHGQPLWELQLGKLADLHPELLLISCREEQQLGSARAEAVYDPPANPGPLPALARCLERAQMPLLALAVDMPRVTVPLLRELVQAGATREQGAVFLGEHGYEPLCAIYPPEALPLLQESLAGGNLRLQAFVQQAVDAGLLRVIPLSKEQEALFLNVNTPADIP
jgi:molybdopterin-guanine dinucleotide biosynthesis protein A